MSIRVTETGLCSGGGNGRGSVVMVGDSEFADVEGAIRDGIDCIKLIDIDEDRTSAATPVVSREHAYNELLRLITAS